MRTENDGVYKGRYRLRQKSWGWDSAWLLSDNTSMLGAGAGVIMPEGQDIYILTSDQGDMTLITDDVEGSGWYW